MGIHAAGHAVTRTLGLAGALALGILLSAPPARGDGGGAAAERRLESALLHKKLNLKGLPKWNRERRTWQPLSAARVALTVVNLWSRACRPCLAELPTLARMAQATQAHHPEVRFLFIADPPDETSPDDVVALWTTPLIELLPGRSCPGTPAQRQGRQLCQIQLPDSDPLRAELPLLGSDPQSQLRPVTLLLDGSGVIRHAFVGSIDQRATEVSEAIDRLLPVLAR